MSNSVAKAVHFMPAKGFKQTKEARERIARGTRWGIAKRRQLALVLPADLVHLQSSGTVAKALRPFLAAAAIEGTALVLGYEGEAGAPGYRPLSAPKKALLDDYLRAGIFMRGELARYVQTQDADAGGRAITAMGRRATLLEKLGLEHVERVIDLNEYVAKHDRAQQAIDAKSEPVPEPVSAVVTAAVQSNATGAPCKGDSLPGGAARTGSPEPQKRTRKEPKPTHTKGDRTMGRQANMKAAARRKVMGTTAVPKTAERRQVIRSAITRLRPAGHVAADLLDPAFEAEDALVSAERTLAAVECAARRLSARFMHAAGESQTGTAAHQLKWLQAAERLRWEVQEAQAAVEQARVVRDLAERAYFTHQTELLNHVAYL